MKVSILHVETSTADADLVRQHLRENNIYAEIFVAKTHSDYVDALQQKTFDLILAETSLDGCSPDCSEGFSGYAAFEIAHDRSPNTPFIFVCRHVNGADVVPYLQKGAIDCITKDQLWRLVPVIQRIIDRIELERSQEQRRKWVRGIEQLVTVVQQLSLARNLDTVIDIVRRTARELTGADGATFILRDGEYCYYVDEDAIVPLWKGRRFPIEICIGGWSMRNRQQVVIEDIYNDERIPYEAYHSTFVKSLVIVPIRSESPIGAIGNYWAEPHHVTPEEVQLLQALADTTSVAMENVAVYADLEQRVQDRTTQLEEANQELEAFSYTLSHDLRTPIAVIKVSLELLKLKHIDRLDEQGQAYIKHVSQATQRIDRLIDDMLILHQVTQSQIKSETVNLSQIAQEIIADLQAATPSRQVNVFIGEDLITDGDSALLRVMLENLLSNAWKYTSKRSQAYIEVNTIPQANGTQIFYIKDNGAGFDMNMAEKLFTPFQRMHSHTDFPGTGIGLTSVQRIIHKHGGRIWVETAINQGATFYFSLP